MLSQQIKTPALMAAGGHTRALGSPPSQIRTYEEVSSIMMLSLSLKWLRYVDQHM